MSVTGSEGSGCRDRMVGIPLAARSHALDWGENDTRCAPQSQLPGWCSPSHLGAAISALEASVKGRSAVRRTPSLTSSAATPRRCWRTGTRSFATTLFGDEFFWGDTLQLHRALAGERHGGVGPGLTATPGAAALPGGRMSFVRDVPAVQSKGSRQGGPISTPNREVEPCSRIGAPPCS